jgi:hypothetical protein
MSEARRIARRSLFDPFRRALAGGAPVPKSAPPTVGFSLASFYEARGATDEPLDAFPRFALRLGIARVDTTRVGAGPESEEKKV